MFDQTIVSNELSATKEAEKTKPQKLTLEQIGQVVYHNSTVFLDKFEADALQELHQVLFESRMIDKLKDMVAFMNSARDSSCTLDQFKNLLLKTMKLQGKMPSQRLQILLQRYRLDEYELAKE